MGGNKKAAVSGTTAYSAKPAKEYIAWVLACLEMNGDVRLQSQERIKQTAPT